MDQFFVDNKFFSTSQAKKAGYDKQFLKTHSDIVPLGCFPTRTDKDGKQKNENFWTFNPDLSNLSKRVKRLSKNRIVNEAEVKELISEIETRLRKIIFEEKDSS